MNELSFFLLVYVGVELSRDHPSEYVDPDLYDDCCWKVFCFRGLSKSIIFLWVNPVVCITKNYFSCISAIFKHLKFDIFIIKVLILLG